MNFSNIAQMDELMRQTTEKECRVIINMHLVDVREFGHSQELVDLIVDMWKKLKSINNTNEQISQP
jgi:hypothetical protein